MNNLFEKYTNDIDSSFISHNLYFFIISVIIFQIIDKYIFKYFPIKIYQVATFMSLYSFINSPLSCYSLLLGGIIATFLSYYIYKLFIYFHLQKKIILLNIITFVSVLITMLLFNCIAMPALAYTLMSYKSIPNSSFNYLSSFIIASIIIIIISFLLLNLLGFINNKLNIFD